MEKNRKKLEVGATGGGKAIRKYPVCRKGEDEHRRRRLLDGRKTKAPNARQHMPEIFAVDTEKTRVSIAKELSEKRLYGDSCSKRSRDRRSCEGRFRSSTAEISSVENVI
jgi:hypothetical protein